jgi:hypothetical protein
MSMPGFTAETSLYPVVGYCSTQHLNTIGKGESFDSIRVLPQLLRIPFWPTETAGSDWQYPHEIGRGPSGGEPGSGSVASGGVNWGALGFGLWGTGKAAYAGCYWTCVAANRFRKYSWVDCADECKELIFW